MHLPKRKCKNPRNTVWGKRLLQLCMCCEINSCRRALLCVARKDERQTFFDKHAGVSTMVCMSTLNLIWSFHGIKAVKERSWVITRLQDFYYNNRFFHNELQISNKPNIIFNFVNFLYLVFNIFYFVLHGD